VELSAAQQEVLGQSQRGKDIKNATRRRRAKILACQSRDVILKKYIHEYRQRHVTKYAPDHDTAKSFYHNLQTGLKEVLGIEAPKPKWPNVAMYGVIRQDKQFVAEVQREVALSYDTFVFDLFAQQVTSAGAGGGGGEEDEEKEGGDGE
jgi:hypothetical protein